MNAFMFSDVTAFFFFLSSSSPVTSCVAKIRSVKQGQNWPLDNHGDNRDIEKSQMRSP